MASTCCIQVSCCVSSQDICCASSQEGCNTICNIGHFNPSLTTVAAKGAQGDVDFIEMSDVAADVAAFLATSTDTTDVLAADTTDVLSAAKAASDGRIKIGPSK